MRPNFTYIPSITRPQQDPHFRGVTGRIQRLLEEGILSDQSGIALRPEEADVFLCGNPDMIEAAKVFLLDLGFTPDKGKVAGTVHIEEYW